MSLSDTYSHSDRSCQPVTALLSSIGCWPSERVMLVESIAYPASLGLSSYRSSELIQVL